MHSKAESPQGTAPGECDFNALRSLRGVIESLQTSKCAASNTQNEAQQDVSSPRKSFPGRCLIPA